MFIRITSIVIAVTFLLSAVGYGIYATYRSATQEETPPKTQEEERQEALDALENLGTLENLEVPTEPMTDVQQQIIKEGDGDLSVEQTDVVSVKLDYALASGQIISRQGDARAPFTTGLQAFAGWQFYLMNMKIGEKRRLIIPESKIDEFINPQFNFPERESLIIDIELVGIAERGFAGFALDSGLQDFEPLTQALTEVRTEDIRDGTGQVVLKDDSLVVNYIGVLAADGKVFDQGDRVNFPLSGVIVGWREGLVGMKVGGHRRVFIPAEKGFGSVGSGELVPPDADLVFDVELIAIQPRPVAE